MTSIFEKNLKFAKQLYTEIINHTENPKKPVIYLIEIGAGIQQAFGEDDIIHFILGKLPKASLDL